MYPNQRNAHPNTAQFQVWKMGIREDWETALWSCEENPGSLTEQTVLLINELPRILGNAFLKLN